jgi:NhaA family Na+:H+ antiporter
MTLAGVLGPVPQGIALGLFVGKQLGVFLTSAFVIAVGWAKLPDGATWGSLYGVSVLTGIGFTMSLFIGSLAFEHAGLDYGVATRAGVLEGSVLAAIVGYLVLRATLPKVSR